MLLQQTRHTAGCRLQRWENCNLGFPNKRNCQNYKRPRPSSLLFGVISWSIFVDAPIVRPSYPCNSWSRDGKRLLSASTDNNVCVWDVLTGECEQKFRFPSPILKVTILVWIVESFLMRILLISGAVQSSVWQMVSRMPYETCCCAGEHWGLTQNCTYGWRGE